MRIEDVTVLGRSNTIIPILLLSLLVSCSSPGKIMVPEVDLLAPPDNYISRLSDIAEDIRYIPLGNSGDLPIGKISSIRVTNENIFVLSGDEIFCFDLEGKYCFRLNMQGRGPGEYTYITKFDVDSNGEFLVLNVFGKLLFYRKVETGFVYEKELKITSGPGYHLTGLNFVPGTHNVLISYSTEGIEEYRNILRNINGDTLLIRPNYYKYKPSQEMGFASFAEILQSSDGHQVCFMEFFNDTIFTVDGDGKFVPELVLNVGKEGIRPEHIANLTRGSAELLKKKLRIDEVLKCGEVFFWKIRYDSHTYFEMLNIEENLRFRSSNGFTLIDDLTGGPDFEPKYSYGGELYSWVEAVTLKEHIKSEHFRELKVQNDIVKQGFVNLVNNLKEEDNPVLMVVRMK
jgi:hypothetical protein